ncbi:related to trehalose-6-phosphate phosphatase [Ceraceosorus bombacis]|uniref:Related to trehalose-6-phosphate phosphatase n=1 Tax=Ceraceosorus bombacis TaxID=401625 RepID=A0A0P1BQD3_9BASI|nr:related to trehalose-6-phosphate phosphatase [Ceraceosorus bombacis]
MVANAPPLTPDPFVEDPPQYLSGPETASRGSSGKTAGGATPARSGSSSSSSGPTGRPAKLSICESDSETTQPCENRALPEAGQLVHNTADGIGGMGVGTAATGDLGASSKFESLQDLRAQVSDLQNDYNARHPDAKLSGRVIHVSHYIPFVIRALAEVEHERQREEKVSATATVAAMAAKARARRAAMNAAKDAEERRLANKPRQGSFIDGMSDTTDLERRLAENQARSRAKAGRKAWMMTPVVDDEEEEDEKDTFTPAGSRRGSTWSVASARHLSFSTFANADDDSKYSAVSDANSPARTPSRRVATVGTPPPPPEPVKPPQWVLAPRRGHTALNSGIRSLCATHRQTFVGWPGEISFAAQARNDERKEASQTTAEERKEIEAILAGLDSADNWAARDAPLLDPKGAPSEAVGKVPTPRMNGAEPIGPDGPARQNAASAVQEHGIKYVPVWLEHNVAHGHYEGYCKTTLWPLLHYLLWQDVPADRRMTYDEHAWDAYVAANEAFAKRIAEEYKAGDMVWIHDYHLLLVPQMLRRMVPDAHIGLFVHAPFPSSEIFRCLPQRREIIEGMLGADLACFQAFSYSRHFLSSCIRVCGFEASNNTVESSNGHITNISYNPIGIDAEKIDRDSRAPGVAPKIAAIREMYKGKKLIIGRDKLDVVRGVIQKLQAFYKLLEEFPEWRGQVVLIQVTAPALNDSPLLERQVSELVSQINGDFGSLNFTPVHHYHQIIEREEYFALLSVADLLLVTTVRDGMSTTPMEFIVFVSHTSHTWAASLLKLLLLRLLSEHAAHFTPPLNRTLMVEKFHKAQKRLILLDYDGTLTPIVKNPADAVPSKRLLEALQKLSEDERNVIYIISGRDADFLDKHLGHLKNLGFSAEHGGYVRKPGEGKWENLTEVLDMSWMQDVKKVFSYFTERVPGSEIEAKKSSMTWHYRQADPDYGAFQAREAQAHLNDLVQKDPSIGVEVLVGKKNLECRPLAVNKGEICKRILYEYASSAEFVFCAGDDKTDEDMFRVLCSLGSLASSGSMDSPSLGACGNPSSLRHATRGESAGHVPQTPADEEAAAMCLAPTQTLVISPPAPLNPKQQMGSPRPMALHSDGIWTTAVGPSSKKTLAHYHVDTVDKIIFALSELAGLQDPADDPPSEDKRDEDIGNDAL